MSTFTEENMSTCKWRVERLLGKGANAKVFLAEETATSKKYALKLFVNESQHNTDEIEILSKLKHQSIIELKEIVAADSLSFCNTQDEEEFIFHGGYAMEFAGRIDLLELISHIGALPEIIVRSYAIQLVDALEHLHTQRIAHRDLKLNNILLDEKFCLKVADFGVSKVFSDGASASGRVGTESYLAPEMITEREYDAFSADIFALGVTIFELVCGYSPFEKASLDDEIYRLIVENNWEDFWALHEDICSDNHVILNTHIKELLQSLLCPEPSRRPSIAEIRTSEWMKKTSLDRLRVESWIVEIAKKRKVSALLPVSSA